MRYLIGITVIILAALGVCAFALGGLLVLTCAIEYEEGKFYGGLSLALTGLVLFFIVFVSGMKPCKNKRWAIGIWVGAMAVSLALLAGVYIAYAVPPRDRHSDRPRDVLNQFLEAAHADEYDKARALWHGRCRRTEGPLDFKEFCKTHFSPTGTYEFSRTGTTKGGGWIIRVKVTEGGRKTFDRWVYITLREDEWKLEREHWF